MLHGAVEFGQVCKLFFAVKVTFPGCEIFGGFYGKPGSFLYIGEVAGSGSASGHHGFCGDGNANKGA